MFSGKVVLITGASSGIGAATAIHFAKEGAKLALTGRNAQNLEDVAQNCEQKSNLRPFTITGDLTVDKDVQNILDETIEFYGKLDVLINNAGIFLLGSIENTNIEQYDKIFATNVRPIYLLTTLALPHLIETKGNVVNISSVAGLRSTPEMLAYCMSKAALDQFTRCVALDLGYKQVRVNSVNPAVIETNILKEAGMQEADIRHVIEICNANYPLRRTGTTEEVAEAIAFLASEKASFTTGLSLTVDGGYNCSGKFL